MAIYVVLAIIIGALLLYGSSRWQSNAKKMQDKLEEGRISFQTKIYEPS